METTLPKKPRIAVLDEIRGLCVVLMVIHHTFYTVGYLFGVPVFRDLFRGCLPVQPLFSGTFYFLCGLCSTLSRNNWKRGALLAGAAGLVSLVMWLFIPEEPIWFGTLHMLAACILLYALCRPLLEKVPGWAGIPACVILTVLFWDVTKGATGYFGIPGVWQVPLPEALTRQGWLYPLGLGRISGVQSDYYPLLPWGLIFFAGSFAGRYLPKLPDGWRRPHLPPLAFVGRHALLIYLAHQPVIWGVTWVIFRIKGAV